MAKMRLAVAICAAVAVCAVDDNEPIKVDPNDADLTKRLMQFFKAPAAKTTAPTPAPTATPTSWAEHPSNFWIPCQQGAWEKWGACDASCGTGTMTRKAMFLPAKKNPKFDASTASPWLVKKWKRMPPACKFSSNKVKGFVYDTMECSSGTQCPIDCAVGNWGIWSVVRRGGVATDKIVRIRNVQIRPQHGGKRCPPTSEYKTFKGTDDCDKAGQLQHSEWSACDGKTKEQHRISTVIKCPHGAVMKLNFKMKQVRPCVPDEAHTVYYGGDYSKYDSHHLESYKFDNRHAMTHPEDLSPEEP